MSGTGGRKGFKCAEMDNMLKEPTASDAPLREDLPDPGLLKVLTFRSKTGSEYLCTITIHLLVLIRLINTELLKYALVEIISKGNSR